MGEPRYPLLSWLGEHGKGLLALVATVATALFATTHAVFYGDLGVSIRDVGIGPVELLSQAALSIAVLGGIFLGVVAGGAWMYRRGRGPEADWATSMGIGAISLIVVLFMVGLAAAMVHDVMPSEWTVPGAVALALIALAYNPWWVGRNDRKHPKSTDRASAAAIVGVAFAIVLVILSVAVAGESASNVRRGVFTDSVFHSLAGAPAPCVNLTWLGETTPAPIPPRAMHLGEANGRVVLYSPGQGPVRVPASDVIVSPAGELDCKVR